MTNEIPKNQVEFYGNLAKDPHVSEKGTFVTVAIPGEVNLQTQKEYGPDFVDVSFFGSAALKASVFRKGNLVHVKGKLSTFQNQEHHKEMRIVGQTIKEVSFIKVKAKQKQKQEQKKEQEEQNQETDKEVTNEENQETVSLN